jgi:hypothetical protein
MEDNQEIGAYMFRRTVPAVHMTPEDVRWMVSKYTCICFALLHSVLVHQLGSTHQNASTTETWTLEVYNARNI